MHPVNGATKSCLGESSSELEGGCDISETLIEGDESAVGEEGDSVGGGKEAGEEYIVLWISIVYLCIIFYK